MVINASGWGTAQSILWVQIVLAYSVRMHRRTSGDENHGSNRISQVYLKIGIQTTVCVSVLLSGIVLYRLKKYRGLNHTVIILLQILIRFHHKTKQDTCSNEHRVCPMPV